MKQNKFWLKLIGIAILLHLLLILISILEVVIYSYLIVPGKGEEFYSAHATVSAPWISAIFGSLFMFLLVRRFVKRFTQQQFTYAIGLPATTMGIDIILFLVSGYELKDVISQFVIVSGIKILAVLLAYFRYSPKFKTGKTIA